MGTGIKQTTRKCPICMWLLIENGEFEEKSENFDEYEGLELQSHLTGKTHTKHEIASLITNKLFLGGISDPTKNMKYKF